MRCILLVFSILFLNESFAQMKTPSVIGYYRYRGGVFYIKEDKTFLVMGYATLITGTWDTQEAEVPDLMNKTKNRKKLLFLTPYRPEYPFMVWGRKDPEIKKGYQIEYVGGNFMQMDEVYIGTDLEQMQAFFNPSPNCFKSEYIYKTKSPLSNEFILADLNENRHSEGKKYNNLFSFPVGNYNNFLVAYIPAEDENPIFFNFVVGKNGLEDFEGNVIKKNKESDFNKEDITFFNSISTENPYLHNDFVMRTKNGNITPYKEFEIIEIEGEKWYKDEEHSQEVGKDSYSLYDEAMQAMVKNKYTKLPIKALPFKKFKPLKTTLFHAECEGEYKNSKRKIYSGD